MEKAVRSRSGKSPRLSAIVCWITLIRLCLLQLAAAPAATLVLPEPPTVVEQDLGTALTNALATTNLAALVALHHCEADEPWAVEWFFQQLLQKPCDEVRIERAEAATPAARAEVERITRANLPLRWIVSLRQPPLPTEATGTNTTLLPASLFDNRIVFTRRMAVFTPRQKQWILLAAGAAVLMAVWQLLKFINTSLSGAESPRYSRLALAVFCLLCGLDFWLIAIALQHFVPQPLTLLALPALGAVGLLLATIHDDRQARKSTAKGGVPSANWVATLRGEWRKLPRHTRIAAILVLVAIAFLFGRNVPRGILISLNEKQTRGTVVAVHDGTVHYRYVVEGHEYAGSGVGDSERRYPVGSTLAVRYSGLLPAVSAIDDPFLPLKQLATGVLIIGGMVWLARRERR